MIELRHLRYFIAVAEELNFRRAAERVHIDQTPLSRTVRDLEDRLGLPLLIRGPRKLTLTPAGLRLLKEARKVFVRMERLQRAVRATDARFHTPLRIGVSDGIAQPKLYECLLRWGEIAPGIALELMEMRASELADALLREEVDAGFSFGLLENKAVKHRPVWSYPAMALLPIGHELASQRELLITDVLAFPLLSWHEGRLPGLFQQTRAIAQRHTTEPTWIGEVATLSGYFTRIAIGMGLGLIDAGHVATINRSGLVAVPLREEEPITTFLLHKRHRLGMQQALEQFVAHALTLN